MFCFDFLCSSMQIFDFFLRSFEIRDDLLRFGRLFLHFLLQLPKRRLQNNLVLLKDRNSIVQLIDKMIARLDHIGYGRVVLLQDEKRSLKLVDIAPLNLKGMDQGRPSQLLCLGSFFLLIVALAKKCPKYGPKETPLLPALPDLFEISFPLGIDSVFLNGTGQIFQLALFLPDLIPQFLDEIVIACLLFLQDGTPLFACRGFLL
mmetsp:Transcript_14203/g.33934  ORF Transcript_14203/g.33934 Transcript_14203/m.33934 type:complete len:204 (+) Transcript_14203:759-1370(+)